MFPMAENNRRLTHRRPLVASMPPLRPGPLAMRATGLGVVMLAALVVATGATPTQEDILSYIARAHVRCGPCGLLLPFCVPLGGVGLPARGPCAAGAPVFSPFSSICFCVPWSCTHAERVLRAC